MLRFSIGLLLLMPAAASALSPDQIVTALSDPPATIKPGQQFLVTDTVLNQGAGEAGASTTRYYLKNDQGKKNLRGSRGIGPLGPSEQSEGTAPVTVYADTVAGAYSLLACADDTRVVDESNDSDNCLASATAVQVLPVPDLVVTAVSDPPAAIEPGGEFSVTDTVLNQGTGKAKRSTTRYYLKNDQVKKNLKGTREIRRLRPSAQSKGTTSVTLYTDTAPGTYSFLACADDTKVVGEKDDNNNCLASATTVVVSQ